MHEGKSSPSAASEIRRVKEENTQLRALLAQRDEQIQKMRADLVKKNSEVFLLKQQLEDIKIDECFSTMPEEITPTKPEPDLPDEMKDIEDMDLDELQQKLRDLHAKVAALQGQTQLVEKKITQLGGVWTTPTEWAQSVIHPPSVVDPLGTLEAREGAPRTASHARSSPSIGFIEDPSTCSSPMASSGDLWTDFVKWMRVHGISTMDDMKEFLSKHMNKRWLEGLEHIPRDSPLQEPENTTNNHNKTTTTYTQQPHHDVPLRTTSANSGGSSNPQALEMSYTSHQSDVEDAPLPTRFADDSGVPTTSTPQLATTTRHQVEHSQHVQQPRTGEDVLGEAVPPAANRQRPIPQPIHSSSPLSRYLEHPKNSFQTPNRLDSSVSTISTLCFVSPVPSDSSPSSFLNTSFASPSAGSARKRDSAKHVAITQPLKKQKTEGTQKKLKFGHLLL